jgi:WD40 repeat protein|mmetsp:Transcript_50312/g.79691  ORF Transcript_50312/g.79691 Transcript_50312/m.79691 type:complete len:855 (-) Transcript_50312:80-2644(-)
MQSTSSQKVAAKASSGKPKNSSNVNQGSTSRTRNTSDNSGGGAGGRTLIFCDGKNVTPKSLAPRKPASESKTDDETKAANLDDDNPVEIAVTEDSSSLVPPPPKTKAQKAQGLTKDELERTVDLILTETATDTLLHYPSLCVALDNVSLTAAVNKRNKEYDELVNSKADSDQYREQHAQTLNHPHKAKEVLAAPPEQESVEVNANTWDIWDTFATDPVPKHVQIQNACEKESEATVALAIKKPGCLFKMDDPFRSDEPAKKDTTSAKDKGKSRAKTTKLGVSSTGSKSLAGGQTTDSVNGPSSGYTEEHEGSSGVAAGRSAEVGSPTGAETSGPTPVEEREEEEEKIKAPVDPIPWKIGANNMIPEELSEALRVMERIVSQNVFHKQHMIYRDYPTLEELEKLDKMREDEGPVEGLDTSGTGRKSLIGASVDDAGDGGLEELDPAAEEEREEPDHEEGTSAKAKLQDLFCFEAPQLTEGVTVTCAEWNTHNQDLLAVSYGDTDPVPNNTKGLVLFWSLKNPTYPERVIRTRTGVTALHFSSAHPNMVSAGTHDGSVMIWDLRRPSDQPVLTSGSSVSQHNDQKHTDIVWETKWVDRGPEKQPPELLVSVSSDGIVYEWSMKKGLEQTLLMRLKRNYNPYLGSNSVYGPKEGMVFRQSSGFCVDFPRGDSSTYLVGTEDGLVHRCSTSYNEQYLATYEGHSGPVYRVRCNPFLSHAFLTCSADWSMKLWSTKSLPGHKANTHLRNFQSTDLCDAVNDVVWAPQNSTSFAACMDDGRVELWDLSAGASDPIVVHYPRDMQFKRRRTCVRFSPNSPVLIAGDDQGSVDVMRMYNTDTQYYSDQEQQDRLNAVMVKKR